MRQVTHGSTNISVDVYIVDDTDGTPELGVLFNTAGLDLEYRREGAVVTNITEVTLAALTTAHSDGGFLEIGHGYYRLDVPDAAFASGATTVSIQGTCTGMVVIPQTIQLVAFDTQDSVRLGLTSLPNAAADEAGGLPISDAGGLDLDAKIGALTYTVANELDVNIQSISDDATAATNLELQYDTNGLTGDNFPATQAQIGSIATGAGGLSTTQDSFTKTVGGTETNDETSTEELDGTLHIVPPDTGNTDIYYEFDVGSAGAVATEFLWDGYVQSNGDSASVWGYDWVSASFKQIGTVTGANGTTIVEQSFTVTTAMTGAGANVGLVRCRFLSSDATNIATDRILCQFTALPGNGTVFDSGVAQAGSTNSITLATGASTTDDFYLRAKVVLTGGTGAGQEAIITDYVGSTLVASTTPAWTTNPDATSVYEVVPAQGHTTTLEGGYDGGAVWVDTVGGSPGTVNYVNGTSSSPVDNIDDAKTIADALNLDMFQIKPGSSFTFTQSFDNYRFLGEGYTIALGGQSISGSRFNNCTISGVGTGVSRPVFRNCRFNAVTLPTCTSVNCTLQDVFTFGSASAAPYGFARGSSTGSGEFNFSSVGSNTLSLLDHQGEVAISNMGNAGTDSILITGNTDVTFNVSCVGGTRELIGNISVTDNSSGMTTVESSRFEIAQLFTSGQALATTTDILDTVTDVTNRVTANTDQIAGDTTSATNLSASALGIETGAAITGTLSTTQMTTDLTETTDDHYIGRIIVWTSGVLANQATDITDYTGSSKLLTYTATTEAPSNTDTFVIV